MNGQPKVYSFNSLENIVTRLRDDFQSGKNDFLLIFSHNGTGKTRLSTEFKKDGKILDSKGRIVERDTLYFNAFTEDLFFWDNDLDNDIEPRLLVNSNSNLINGFSDLDIGESIRDYFHKYCSAQFEIIRYTAEEVEAMAKTSSPLHYLYRRFGVEVETRPKCIEFKAKDGEDLIKISRGEERIFVWSTFLAILKQVLSKEGSYSWVKYLYIDDPVSSLDDNNIISVACDLAKILEQAKHRTKLVSLANSTSANDRQEENVPLKVIVSSHHTLFFNVIFNELKSSNCKFRSYFLHRATGSSKYTLQSTTDTPFFHHIALLSELVSAANDTSAKLYQYHFNILRSILEKTAVFFGKKDFSDCIESSEDKDLFSRVLNLHSHGGHSIFEPVDMTENDRELFRRILINFKTKFDLFDLPNVLAKAAIPDTATGTPAP